MEKRSKKRVLIAIGILLSIALMVIIFFLVPYSKTKIEFDEMSKYLIEKTDPIEGVFKEEDIAGLPAPVQRRYLAL